MAAGFAAVIQHLDSDNPDHDRGFHLSASVKSKWYIAHYMKSNSLSRWFDKETAALLRTLKPGEGVHCILMPQFSRSLTKSEIEQIAEHDAEKVLSLDDLRKRLNKGKKRKK